MPRLRHIVPGVVAAALVAGLTLAARPLRSAHVAGAALAAPALVDTTTDRADAGRIQGSPSATLWVIEGSDFQCPYCKMWHDSVYATMVKEYVNTGKIRFAFMNYPLSMHPYAKPAAEAAMCASVQGKFWPMHDALFATQTRWETLANPMPAFDSLAVKTGVNAAAWRKCVSTHATADLVAADLNRMRMRGAGSTPTFYIGDKMVITGAAPLSMFRDSLNKALAKPAKR